MYLRGRDPLVVNSNPFFVLEEDPTPSRNSQVGGPSQHRMSCLRESLSFRYHFSITILKDGPTLWVLVLNAAA